jgi:hypothetical protein
MVTRLVILIVSALLFSLGYRVFRGAAQSGQLPERMIGLYFMSMGIGAAPALTAQLFPVEPHLLLAIRAFGHAALSLGYMALVTFIWKTFGPDSQWRRALATSIGLCLFGMWFAQGFVDGFQRAGSAIRITALLRGSALIWALCETCAYRLRLRRQLALGLGDPIVANRITLWCCWIGGLLSATAIVVGVRFLFPEFETGSPAARGLIIGSVIGCALTSSVSLALSFFPPDWYLDRIRVTAS